MSTLGERIDAGTDALEAVLGWVADLGLEPYPAQEEAILELCEGHHVVLATPTGSGKSLVAVALHAIHLAAGERSVYTAPIKALVSEKFFALCEVFGADRVGMMTGDGSVNPDAPILCCTAEILEQIALREGEDTRFDGVVMDEFHYYGDRDRGRAWQIPLITMKRARFLLMSATLGPTKAIEAGLEEYTGRSVTLVANAERPVPLTFTYSEEPALDTLETLVRGGSAPVYAVHFTQREATELAQGLLSTDFTSKEDKERIKKEVRGLSFSSPFGKHIRRMVLHGVGLHHAGLLPRYRLLVEKLAQKGLFRVICGTDTLGVGINVPIRTVFFTQLCKFDGEKVDILSVRDFKQIAGRAGRKGFDSQGQVVVQAPAWVVENKRTARAVEAGKKKKSKSKVKQPTRGYKHWDASTFDRLVNGQSEGLTARFKVDHALVLARLRRAEALGTDPLEELDSLIDAAHTGERATARLKEEARQRIVELVVAGVAEPVLVDGQRRYTVYDDLQHDFSLHHGLSLFLLHLVEQLDRDDPDYPLDVLSCVEAILEHPKVVLRAQVHKARGERIGELKAAGVPYEERLEALEDVTWPKPRAEWFYAQYEAWRTARPWLAEDPIRVKAVVREMVETQAVFSTTVKDLGIDRAEGVLLRYISQVYKTLIQGVPADARTDELVDVIGFLRAMLARVDDSLVRTWEALTAAPSTTPDAPALPPDISRDSRAFRARIRAELHAVVRALAADDPDEAVAAVHVESLDARALAAGLKPFVEELGPLAFDGRIRQGWATRIDPLGPHRWAVSQRLLPLDLEVDPDEVSWSLVGEVDLTEDTSPSGPIVRLRAIEE